MTFTEVEDCGWQKGQGGGYDSEKGKAGKIGDGKIFVTSIEEPIRIRTGENGLRRCEMAIIQNCKRDNIVAF